MTINGLMKHGINRYLTERCLLLEVRAPCLFFKYNPTSFLAHWVPNRTQEKTLGSWEPVPPSGSELWSGNSLYTRFILTLRATALSFLYGVGYPPDELNETYMVLSRKYFFLQEPFYCMCTICLKTGIGITLVRTLCVERRYRYTVYAAVGASNAAYVGYIVWYFGVCQPMAANWDQTVGKCVFRGDGPLIYLLLTISTLTDAACATIPTLALRPLRMSARQKYPLMAVFSVGALAAAVSAARFPFSGTLRHRFDHWYSCK